MKSLVAIFATIVLLVNTALAVIRQRGLTPHGWRKLRPQRSASQT